MREVFFQYAYEVLVAVLTILVVVAGIASYTSYRKLVPQPKLLTSRLKIEIYPNKRVVYLIDDKVLPIGLVPFVTADMAHVSNVELYSEFCDARGEIIVQTETWKRAYDEFLAALQEERDNGYCPQGYISQEVAALAPFAFERQYYVQSSRMSARSYSVVM